MTNRAIEEKITEENNQTEDVKAQGAGALKDTPPMPPVVPNVVDDKIFDENFDWDALLASYKLPEDPTERTAKILEVVKGYAENITKSGFDDKITDAQKKFFENPEAFGDDAIRVAIQTSLRIFNNVNDGPNDPAIVKPKETVAAAENQAEENQATPLGDLPVEEQETTALGKTPAKPQETVQLNEPAAQETKKQFEFESFTARADKIEEMENALAELEEQGHLTDEIKKQFEGLGGLEDHEIKDKALELGNIIGEVIEQKKAQQQIIEEQLSEKAVPGTMLPAMDDEETPAETQNFIEKAATKISAPNEPVSMNDEQAAAKFFGLDTINQRNAITRSSGVASYDKGVELMQETLIELNPKKYGDILKYKGSDGIDGKEGPRTREAVEAFAKELGLNASNLTVAQIIIEAKTINSPKAIIVEENAPAENVNPEQTKPAEIPESIKRPDMNENGLPDWAVKNPETDNQPDNNMADWAKPKNHVEIDPKAETESLTQSEPDYDWEDAQKYFDAAKDKLQEKALTGAGTLLSAWNEVNNKGIFQAVRNKIDRDVAAAAENVEPDSVLDAAWKYSPHKAVIDMAKEGIKDKLDDVLGDNPDTAEPEKSIPTVPGPST